MTLDRVDVVNKQMIKCLVNIHDPLRVLYEREM